MRAYDSDNNGFFDGGDARYGEFRIWRDLNQDGISQAGELCTLAELNVTHINLTFTPTGAEPGGSDNSLYATTEFIRGDGSRGIVGDAFMAYEPSDAEALAPPIVFDFDGDNAGLISLQSSTTRFDMTGDGIADKTGWIEQGDAFLSLDRNANGLIDNLSEISFVGDKEGAKTDLEGLAAFDSNGDGVLDGQDSRFVEFKLWFDRNSNGKTDAGELLSLAEANVASINLAGTATEETASSGSNIVYNRGGYTLNNGQTGGFMDVGLAYKALREVDYQEGQWSGKAKNWQVSASAGALHVKAREAQGVIDANAGLISPASILDLGNSGIGMLQTIILDLDGDGLEARRRQKTEAVFDMDADGVGDDTGWTSGGDGFLVIDRNNDGKIGSTSELTFLAEKADAKNVWEGLATLDTNRDGKLSVADTNFGTLKVWQDGNSNGSSEAGELKTLADLGIKEVGLATTPVSAETKAGRNVPLSTASFTRENGVTATIGTVALAFDPSSLRSPEPLALAPNAQAAQLAAAQLAQAMSSFVGSGSEDLARFSTITANQGIDLLTASAA